MSDLEVIETCPPQRKALLSSLGVANGSSPSVIKFETHGVHIGFPYYVSLLVHVECLNNTIKRIVIDEGTVASMISLSCWKGLGSTMLSKSGNMLISFDGT